MRYGRPGLTDGDVVIDAGNMINNCSASALYAADSIFLVTNPDVSFLVDDVDYHFAEGEAVIHAVNDIRHLSGQALLGEAVVSEHETDEYAAR